MKRLPSFVCILSILIVLFTVNVALAEFAGGGPKPGDIYKEFTFNNNKTNWRVTDSQAYFKGVPGNSPATFLPNPKLHINLDKVNAIKAEIVIDKWGGHPGTTNKQFRFNGRQWITIPELDDLPTAPPPSSLGEKYVQQINHLIPISLDQLNNGDNYFEGECGDNGWGWGQWGWYGTVVRVYYSPSKLHATGQIKSPSSGSRFGENPTILAETSGGADRVDFLAYYEGFDSDGDGVFLDWHRNYHRTSLTNPIGIRNHVGTDTGAPYQVTWNTQWVPDQPIGQIKLIARVRHTSGTWYVTNVVSNLTLVRNNSSVKLYKPKNVPQLFWVRAGNVKSSLVNISTMSGATAAVMNVGTWNGNDGTNDFYSKVNALTLPKYGKNHFYSFDQISVPVNALKNGDNTISFKSTTAEHGIEVLWPGPHILVRYGSAAPPPPPPPPPPAETAPSITQQPSSKTVTVGQTATFSVTATGTAPLSYQWMRDGNTIPGATSASYMTPPALLGDDGSVFRCIVSNSYGDKTSNGATLTVSTSSTPPPPPPTSDIVQNSGFEDGKSWWNFYTNGQGSFVVSSPGSSSTNAAKVTTVTGGTNIQLFQYGIPLAPNTDYQLSFNAYSNSGHGLSVSMAKHDSPYTNYGLSHEQIDLTTSWKTYTLTFRTKNFSAPVDNARLMFWFANEATSGDMFWIDNVVITKGGSSTPPPASDTVMNPGFEQGKTWWNFYTNGQGSFVVSSPGYSSTNAAKVTTVTGGTNIQLFQYGIPLEPNTDYQLSFNAYSNTGHGFSASILKHDSPYTNYGLSREQINPTTSWKTYTLTFRTKNFGAPVDDARLMFWFADDATPGDMFWIDNVVITKAGSSTPPPSSDTVMNPGFEQGKTWWNFYTKGQGSFMVSSPGYSSTNAAKVTTVTGGTNIQLFQYGIPLEPNTAYQLSFNAYSNTGHGFSASILKHDSPYTNYGLSREQINLTTSWKTYTLTFRTKNFGAPVDDARLMFWFADDAAPGDMFWIDNVVITPLN